MATIETNEGQTLIVEGVDRQTMYVDFKLETDSRRTSVDREVKVYDLYRKNALDLDEKPRSRGDLTAAKVEQVADLLIGYAVAEGWAETRSGVRLVELEFVERDRAKVARKPLVPSYDDDWPEDGTASDKVRFMLEEYPTHSDEEMAVIAGCSRSLVSELKAEREEE